MSFLSSILPIVGGIAGSFIPGVGTAIGAGLGAAVGGAMSSSDAADAQQQGAQNAIDTQWRMFNQTQQNLLPYLTSGQLANKELMRMLGFGGTTDNPTFNPNAPLVKPFGMEDFYTDPGYKYRLNEGLNAILSKRSALGGINSGATMKALNDYAQAGAAQEFGNAYNRYNQNQTNLYSRIQQTAGSGQNAATGLGSFGQNSANAIGNAQMGIGDAQAAGIVGGANAITRGIGQAGSQYLLGSALQNGQPTGGNPGDYLAYYAGSPRNAVTDFFSNGYRDPSYADTMGAGWAF